MALITPDPHAPVKNVVLVLLILFASHMVPAAEETPVPAGAIVPPTPEWKQKIAALAPAEPRVKPQAPRRILMCSLATGYCHAVIPHVKEVIDVLAKTGAFTVTHSDDVAMFDAAKLKDFDAVVINNTCTKNPTRNLFLDALAKQGGLSAEQQQVRAAELENALTGFVAEGKGLVAIHGAIVFLNESANFSQLLGASFEMHPSLQRVSLTIVDPKHPLVAAFQGEPFVHTDEPYLFRAPYKEKNFRPLLEMDVAKLNNEARSCLAGDRRYVSWIKKHGKGRVFYVSPSHQPESYESSRMLKFYLDGIQYALGDLACDDSPVGNP